MKMPSSISHPEVTHSKKAIRATAADRKEALVDIGLYALARGEWRMVQAITRLIQVRGWQHA